MKIFAMTKTVARNLLQGPATLMYPQQPRKFTAISRGSIENAIERCIFCGLCSRRCPTYAIAVTKEKREWQISRLNCCMCNLCVEVCPVKCLSTANKYSAPVFDKNSAVHLKSAPPAAEPAQ